MFLKKSVAKGLGKGEEALVKGKLQIEQSLGLGHKPNVIPPDEAFTNCPQRTVEIGWHPVAGFAGKWFAEETGLGKMITEKINRYPDPTQHWAVLAGDYCHQLWMDEHLDVIYTNERILREDWHTFEVGKTSFNDEAIRQAAEMTIYNIRHVKPGYNLITNNCQGFVNLLLDAILAGGHQQFATTFAVYQRATGKGKILDLFVDPPPGDGTDQTPTEDGHDHAMQTAHQVMDQNTTKLDHHHSIF